MGEIGARDRTRTGKRACVSFLAATASWQAVHGGVAIDAQIIAAERAIEVLSRSERQTGDALTGAGRNKPLVDVDNVKSLAPC